MKKTKASFRNNKINDTEEILPNRKTNDHFFIKPSKSGASNKSTQVNVFKQNKLSKSKARLNIEKNSSNSEVKSKDKKESKPFDKKRWRIQKYSNKFKLQQWEDKRKKAVLREYYKTKDDDDVPKIDVKKIYEEDEERNDAENDNNVNLNLIDEDSTQDSNKSTKKTKPVKRAHQEFLRIKEEKKKKKEEHLKRKTDRDEALKAYKMNKVERFKKLNKKTKKGQPIMKERMQMLLEKIQNSLK